MKPMIATSPVRRLRAGKARPITSTCAAAVLGRFVKAHKDDYEDWRASLGWPLTVSHLAVT